VGTGASLEKEVWT